MVSREKIQNALEIAVCVGALIKARGRIPSGELYALLCGKFDLAGYESLIRFLEKQNLIRVENHLITWQGE